MTLKLNGTTSGSVSLDAPATGSDVSLTLPGSVGTSGQLLSTDGAGVLSFVNGGKILQVVRATDSTNRSTTSTSFVDASLSVTITPQKSNSTVLLVVSVSVIADGTTDANNYGQLAITDSSNNGISGATDALSGIFNFSRSSAASPAQSYTHFNIWAWASPGTTSATTYKLRWRAPNANITVSTRNASNVAQMFAIEVAA